MSAAAVWAQSAQNSQQLTRPSAPKAPSHPSVSSPKIGSGFYTPGSGDFYSGVKKPSAPVQNNTSASSGSTNTTAASQATSSQALTQNISTAANITAQDLTKLDSMGLLGNFSSLLSKNSVSSAGTGSDTLLLQQILRELSSIKESVSQVQAPSKPAAASNKASSDAKILRFWVNGYDLLTSFRQVYFSTEESDGSFMLTADRKYQSGNKILSETFYILFKATGNSGGIITYNVSTELVQETKNPSSPVSILASQKNLKASRTGNLVKIVRDDQDFRTNILLSMD